MMILNPYSIPAMFALLAKLVILHLARRAKFQDGNTRLFQLAVWASMTMNVAEITLLNHQTAAFLHIGFQGYYAAGIVLVTLLTRLAVAITFDYLAPWAKKVIGVYYALAASLIGLVLFTSSILAGVQHFRDYSYARVPGDLYWLFETFAIASCLTFIFLPIYGLRAERPPRARSQCKLWVVTATPPVILIIVVLILLRLEIHIFNGAATLPLILAAHLAAVGYAIHNRRIVEVDFYIPKTTTRRIKREFYRQVLSLIDERGSSLSLNSLLVRLAQVFESPVCLLSGRGSICAGAADEMPIGQFPLDALRNVDTMLTLDDLAAGHVELAKLMLQHRVAAIVPFDPHSPENAQWMLLGDPFNRKVYTPLDFRVVNQAFQQLEPVVTRAMLATTVAPESNGTRTKMDPSQLAVYGDLQPDRDGWTLEDRLRSIERFILEDTLRRCGGKKAEAARQLGLRPNTLHYKLRRHGLLRKGEDS